MLSLPCALANCTLTAAALVSPSPVQNGVLMPAEGGGGRQASLATFLVKRPGTVCDQETCQQQGAEPQQAEALEQAAEQPSPAKQEPCRVPESSLDRQEPGTVYRAASSTTEVVQRAEHSSGRS